MADRTGQRLGNYVLGLKIGEGGFAEVYLGEHIELGTQAAIKVLNSKISDDEIAKFRAEARLIAQLKHPHIIRVLDFGVEQGGPYLIMDYAPGGTLRQKLPKGVQHSPTSLLLYVRQVVSALQYAHTAKIIHRDIKPENMLLNERGEVLLSDFGIAVLALSSRVQDVQQVAGTAAYMAPEQITANAHFASDQYALGIVLYEWLAGERPFEGTTSELYGKHIFSQPPPLSEKVPTISSAVEEVVMTALKKDPKERFASIQAFATAFEQACLEPSRPLMHPISAPVALPPTIPVTPAQTPQLGATIFYAATQQAPAGPVQPPPPSFPGTGSSILSQPTRASDPALAESALLRQPEPEIIPELTAAPHAEERPGISRRKVLAVGAGVASVALVGGAAAWLGLAQKSSTGSPIARATATPFPTPTTDLTPSATSTPRPITITTPVFTYRGHTRALNEHALAWSPEPGVYRIASGGWDGLQMWDALTGNNALSLWTTDRIVGLAWSPDGHKLAFDAVTNLGGSNGNQINVRVGDMQSHAILAVSSFFGSSLAWSPDGQRIASGGSEPFVQVWKWQSGGAFPSLWRGHAGEVWAVDWSPDGKYLASASVDQTTIIWDAASSTPLKTLKSKDTTTPLLSVSWAADSTRVAVGDQQGQVIIWDIQTGNQLYKHSTGDGGPWIWALAWSPDGTRIASSGLYHGQNIVEVWDAETGNTRVRYTGHLSDVQSVAWSPDSKYIASGSNDTTVQVWQPG